MKENNQKRILEISLIIGVLLITLSLLHSPGHGDMDTFAQWAKTASEKGVVNGYSSNQADYPPLTTVIMFLAAQTSRVTGIWLYTSIKLVILVSLILTSLIFWLWTRNLLLTVVLHLALLLNTMALGYIDIFIAPWFLLALWGFKGQKWLPATCAFCIAFLLKWQPLVIAPFIALFILGISQFSNWKSIDYKKILVQVVLPVVVVISLVLAIFGAAPVWQAFTATSGHNALYLSGNALNLNWIITHFLHVFNPDRYGALVDGQAELIKTASPSLTSVSSLLFGLVFLVTLVKFFRREKTFENLVRFSLLGYWAYFMFNPGVHENHLFIVLLLAVILYWLNKEHVILMICIILMANFNLYLFYGSNGLGPGFSRVIGGFDLALVGAIFNLLFFCLVWWMNVRPEKRHVTHQPVA